MIWTSPQVEEILMLMVVVVVNKEVAYAEAEKFTNKEGA